MEANYQCHIGKIPPLLRKIHRSNGLIQPLHCDQHLGRVPSIFGGHTKMLFKPQALRGHVSCKNTTVRSRCCHCVSHSARQTVGSAHSKFVVSDLDDSTGSNGREYSRRHSLLGAAAFLNLLAIPAAFTKPALASAPLAAEALAAFNDALRMSGSFEDKDKAWTRVIQLAPDNSAAWSNRGTLRLQSARWLAAESDLAYAVALEAGITSPASSIATAGGSSVVIEAVAGLPDKALDNVDPSTLNNLGNAEVAVGKLAQAQVHFQAAARDPGLRDIALANLALAAFENHDDTLAIRVARQVLRRDPQFLDARLALVAFLYATGQSAAAEGQWEELQEAEDGLGAYLYNKEVAVARVRNRWPPRATAALTAFLSLSSTGEAQGYDMEMHTYSFGQA